MRGKGTDVKDAAGTVLCLLQAEGSVIRHRDEANEIKFKMKKRV